MQARILVFGEVQGVGFRYFALQRARALGLNGFVRNLSDGSVEAVVQGSKKDLEEFVAELKNGPSSGSVREARVFWEKQGRKFEGFGIEASA